MADIIPFRPRFGERWKIDPPPVLERIPQPPQRLPDHHAKGDQNARPQDRRPRRQALPHHDPHLQRAARAGVEGALGARARRPLVGSARPQEPVLAWDWRVGGKWEIETITGDGSKIVFFGEYLEIEKPSKVTQTFSFDQLPPGAHSVDAVTLIEKDGKTIYTRRLDPARRRVPRRHDRLRHGDGRRRRVRAARCRCSRTGRSRRKPRPAPRGPRAWTAASTTRRRRRPGARHHPHPQRAAGAGLAGVQRSRPSQRAGGVLRGFTNPVCELDFRVGGHWHNVMRGPDGRRVSDRLHLRRDRRARARSCSATRRRRAKSGATTRRRASSAPSPSRRSAGADAPHHPRRVRQPRAQGARRPPRLCRRHQRELRQARSAAGGGAMTGPFRTAPSRPDQSPPFALIDEPRPCSPRNGVQSCSSAPSFPSSPQRPSRSRLPSRHRPGGPCRCPHCPPRPSPATPTSTASRSGTRPTARATR